MDQQMPSSSGRIAYKQLEKILEDILLSFKRQDIQKLKSVLDLTQHHTLVHIDLSTIYDFIQKQAFQFYNLTKWGLENHMEELGSDFLNIIFIISCISLDTTAEDQEEEVELPLFYEELNASFSTSEVSCSFETEKITLKEIDISEKVSAIIMKNPHKLVDLIKLLFLKKRQAEISALETLVHRGLGSSENHGLELAQVFAKEKSFQEATYTFNNVKQVASGIPQFIDVMIANCMVSEDISQPAEAQKLKEVESFAETADKNSNFNSIKMNIHLGITFFTKNNYVKAYHYYQKAWKLYKSFPETCYQFALTLFHLQMFDDAFAVLEKRDISMTTVIQRAIDINLLGDIEGFRGNYEKAEEHFQMSFKLFCYGYEQNRTFIDFITLDQQNLNLAVGSVDDIYKNFFSKPINDYRFFQNVQKNKLDKEIRNIRISKILNLFRDYIERSGSNYPEPFLYMTKLHLLNKRPHEAMETYLLLLSMMLQKKKMIRPQFFLSFFLQMKTIPLFLVEQKVIRDTDELIQKLRKEINCKIKSNFTMGVQYSEMRQFDTAKIAFHEVMKLENYKQKVDLQLFHYYILSCYRHLELTELGVQYIEREVDTLIITTPVSFLLEYYCRALNNKQIKELFQKIRIQKCNRGSYLQFIRMMIKKGLGKDIKEQLDILELQLQRESDNSIQLCELGQLYYEVKEYSKALLFLKKGLIIKDQGQQPNQFYLARVLTILNTESASLSEQEEHIIQQLQLTKTENSDILTEIGKFYLKKQNVIDGHSCFERAFSFSLNQTTFQHYLESCLCLKKEEKALHCIKTYIQRLMEELQFQESAVQFVKNFVDPTEKAQYYLTCKKICDLCKKMTDISPLSLSSSMEKGITLRSVYFDALKKYSVSVFERERLSNDKYIAELIDLSTQQGKHEETLFYIKNLIQKYPRYPSFLKIKEFCRKKCHDQGKKKESICPNCQQIILKNQHISLISQLFLITEVQDQEESTIAFKKWFEEVQRCLKQGKRGGFPFGKKDLIDMCPILTFAEAKNKEKSSVLVIYKGMLQLLFNKSVASKSYKKDLICSLEEGNQSEDESFHQWFSSFLKFLKNMGMQSQIFLLNFIYYFGKAGSQQRKMLIQKQIRCILSDQILEKLKSVSILQ